MVEQNKNLVIVDARSVPSKALIDAKTIKEKIYNIRNQKVMLDVDLAEIYGYSTRAVSYTHLTLPTTIIRCRSRWSPYH